MMPIDYPLLLATLSINLVLLFLVAYVFFYRRHKRRDIFVAICLINISLFVLGGALVVLAMGLTLGLPTYDLPVQTIYAVLLVVAVYVVDHSRVLPQRVNHSFSLTTDYVDIEPNALKQKVKNQLGHTVQRVQARAVTTAPIGMKLEIES